MKTNSGVPGFAVIKAVLPNVLFHVQPPVKHLKEDHISARNHIGNLQGLLLHFGQKIFEIHEDSFKNMYFI